MFADTTLVQPKPQLFTSQSSSVSLEDQTSGSAFFLERPHPYASESSNRLVRQQNYVLDLDMDLVTKPGRDFELLIRNTYERVSRFTENAPRARELEETFEAIDRLTHVAQSLNIDLKNITIQLARHLAQKYYYIAQGEDAQWHAPHMTLSDEEEIVFEWWHGEHKLTFYISSNAIQYLKVWGFNIWNDMDEGTNPSYEELVALWRWLHHT
jgi:hypothetical protein